ncbi:MAG: PsbP-related protein [Patescibacteria group bacterium]
MNKKILIYAIIILVIFAAGSAGYVWYVGNSGQLSEQQSTTQTQDDKELITSDIDTSDWQTYRNEEYGFEFKYPEGWEIGRNNPGIIRFYETEKRRYLEGTETYSLSVAVYEYDTESLQKIWVQTWKGNRKVYQDSFDVKIGELNALRGSTTGGLETLINRNGYTLNFAVAAIEDDLLAVYDRILLTLNFENEKIVY